VKVLLALIGKGGAVHSSIVLDLKTARLDAEAEPKRHRCWAEDRNPPPPTLTTVPPRVGPLLGAACSSCTLGMNSNLTKECSPDKSSPSIETAMLLTPALSAGVKHTI
jgi:hypothetical protein